MVTKIFWSKTQLRFEHENENFELDAHRERKPMKLFSHKCRDVRESREAGYKSGSSIQYRLKRR